MDAGNSDKALTAGSHCEYPKCNRLDFLPFRCELCCLTFCLDHRLSFSHDCTNLASSPDRGSSAPIELYSCEVPDCFGREHLRIECPSCRKNFCLAHRHAEDHVCSGEPKKHEELVAERIKLDLPPTKIEAVPPPKPRKAKSLNPTAVKVMRMKLKMSAVGEKQIPEAERIFLEIILLDGTRKSVFVCSEWSFGRACDSVKNLLRVGGKSADPKLRDPENHSVISPDRLVKDILSNTIALEFYLP